MAFVANEYEDGTENIQLQYGNVETFKNQTYDYQLHLIFNSERTVK